MRHIAAPHTTTMSENKSSLFHLELIRQRDLSEQEADIVSAFARGIYPATTETVLEAARQLDYL
jgi:hypothetical protein